MAPEYIDQHGVQRSRRRRRGLHRRFLGWLERGVVYSWIWRNWRWGGLRLLSRSHGSLPGDDDDPLRRDDPVGIPEADLTPQERREALRRYSRYREEEKLDD